MGAWIETLKDEKIKSVAESHPTWVRGLKLEEQELAAENAASHPTWVRGLKLLLRLHVPEQTSSRTLRGCVD